MSITLEQARALDAIARHGTFAKAASALTKGHTAVIYAVKSLEAQLDLELLDRSSYRNTLTPAGERILEQCRVLLRAESELIRLSQELKSGWEPYLQVVMDGIVPMEPFLRSIGALERETTLTTVKVFTAFLSGVEQEFVDRDADFMVSVLPPVQFHHHAIALSPIQARLVVHRGHSLAKADKVFTLDELRNHTLISVRGSDPRLNLSTQSLDSHFQVNDFHSKRLAILNGLGFGWLPEYLIEKELASGIFQPVQSEIANSHIFHPKIFYLHGRKLGKAAESFLALVKKTSKG